MTDRLKDIWSRFENKTQRTLTSSNIDNIPRPVIEEMHRRNDGLSERVSTNSARPEKFPEDLTPPAQQAFTALRSRLVGFDEKGRPSRKKVDPVSELEDAPMDQMLVDLKATEQRVARRELDYRSWFKEQETRRARKPRKKFLGIF